MTALPRDEIRAALAPGHFFLGGTAALEWRNLPAEEVAWEVFQGRLLDAAQTRERQTFEAWDVYLAGPEGVSAEPLLSVKLDVPGRKLHVVRAVYCYAWEGYHAGDNVYLSRETKKWLRELVGTFDLAANPTGAEVRAWLGSRLAQAVFGSSRLPLTSLEAPLPSFSLGELAYFPYGSDERASTGPMRTAEDLIRRGLTREQPWPLKAKWLETLLRSTPAAEIPGVADGFVGRWEAIGHKRSELPALFQTLFDDVALSPYTDFVDRTLAFLQALEARGHWSAEAHADFLGALLRQLARHLTAFDLHTFHHRGANYPDALLLDAALQSLLRIGERQPDLFLAATPGAKRRRRAVRQAGLLRLGYEGHPVPDHPTSPGENSRVLPPRFPRVPEEQIIDPAKRTRKLYDGDPLVPRLGAFGRDVLRAALRDLDDPAELHELGMALFLDRPLGLFKRPGEPDETPLLSYQAYSAVIAGRRLKFLAERLSAFAAPADWARWGEPLQSGPGVPGVALQRWPAPVRPGVASLNDAFRIADDFVLLRTTRRAAREFLAACDLAALAAGARLEYLAPGRRLLIVAGAAVGGSPGTLLVCDDQLRPRLELEIDREAGLRPRRAWDVDERGQAAERDLTGEADGVKRTGAAQERPSPS